MVHSDVKSRSYGEKKILHIELEEPLNSKFDMVKEHLGLKNDGEVVRFLLTDYFNHHLKKELEGKREAAKQLYISEIGPALDTFMKNYGDQWHRLGEDD